jgi:hypothetical protein
MGQSHPWRQRHVKQVRNDLRQCGTINNACPGYVATDLNGFSGTQTPEQGAAIAIRLATLTDDGPTGQLFDDNGPVPWCPDPRMRSPPIRPRPPVGPMCTPRRSLSLGFVTQPWAGVQSADGSVTGA